MDLCFVNSKVSLAIRTDKIYFLTLTEPEYLEPILDSEPPTMVEIDEHFSVRSQSLAHRFRWKDKSKKVADWPLTVDGFGNGWCYIWGSVSLLTSVNSSTAQQADYHPEINSDYSCAPETLLRSSTCSLQTDIWMLGYMVSRIPTPLSSINYPHRRTTSSLEHRHSALDPLL